MLVLCFFLKLKNFVPWKNKDYLSIEQKEKATNVSQGVSHLCVPGAFCFVYNLKHKTTLESFLVRKKKAESVSVLGKNTF